MSRKSVSSEYFESVFGERKRVKSGEKKQTKTANPKSKNWYITTCGHKDKRQSMTEAAPVLDRKGSM